MEEMRTILKIYQDAKQDLCDTMPTNAEFLQNLVDDNVISGGEKEDLENIRNRRERRQEIVEILREKPNEAYFKFVEILKNHQPSLYQRLKDLEKKHKLTQIAVDDPLTPNPTALASRAAAATAQPPHPTVPMASTDFDLDPPLATTVANIVKTLVNEEGQVTVRGRTIIYKAQGRVHSLKEPWVYDGTAWDVESGISEKARHYMSKQGAIEHAMLKLMERLKRDGKLGHGEL